MLKSTLVGQMGGDSFSTKAIYLTDSLYQQNDCQIPCSTTHVLTFTVQHAAFGLRLPHRLGREVDVRVSHPRERTYGQMCVESKATL